jgi:phosphate transport system ATP-binding protein
VKYAVEIEKLNVYINGFHALKDVDLRVPQGSIFAVMGPSGSGKTTLLKVINRLIDLVPGARVEGSVRVLGVDALRADPYELRKKVGMMFQIPNPFPHMTVYENVAVSAKLNGAVGSRRELDQVVKWALETAMLWEEVKHRLDRYPSELSGGQRQRLCLARALAMRPELLLLDEPTANIDPVNARKLEEAIASLKGELTIIMVTHLPRQALRVADYVAIIYDGKIVEYGSSQEVFVRPSHTVTQLFLKGEV